jgi:ubiquitin-protein ligase E3 A
MHNLTFTLLSYTWLFNASSKYILINLYNDNSKKDIILESVFNLLNENNTQQSLDNLNFTLSVRRDNLIEDTLEQLSKQNINLRSPLKIDFIGEEGVDQGGLKKEFFMLITRKIFTDEYNLFSYNSKTHLFWFNLNNTHQSKNYELIGIIIGLAIYNSIILDIKFPLVLYKKILKVEPSLEDLKEIDIELYNNLCYILDSDEEDLEDKLDSNFTVLTEKNGEKIILPLIENGENIMINNENKKEYVELFIDWYFNKSIEDYYSSFEHGFSRVFDEDLLKILTPEELELIICGSSNLNFDELKKVCIYKDGYNEESLTIKYFWEVVFDFDKEEKRKLLSFITGCDRAPINGLGNLVISITKLGSDINKLPSAHTCFNDLLLPDYKNKELLKKFLLIAINFSEGFGLS